MSDIFDLLGDNSKKPKKRQAEENDSLDFLGGFKKKVQRGEFSSSKRNDNQDGVTALDIANLPEDQKRIMFALLRDKTAKTHGWSFEQLYDEFGDDGTLEPTLEALIDANWLSVLGEAPDERYKVNLKRKRGRLSDNLWSALDD